jgi:tRNA pseudouridine55 synthase
MTASTRMPLSGVLIVDKPENISSAQAVARVKRWLKAEKVGHAGTLDPFATGVLVCCLNAGTRLARFLLTGTKKYRAILELGVSTDTQDRTGAVQSRCRRMDYSAATLHSVFRRFTGDIEQVPPVYSALKHRGVPLYKLARQGHPVEKSARQVVVSELNILEIALPRITFDVTCSAGTYIRTLCADIGTELGCGGHLQELRRTHSSGFSIAEAVALNRLETLAAADQGAQRVIGMAAALRGMAQVVVPDRLVTTIATGGRLRPNDLELPATARDFIKIVDRDNRLLAVVDLNTSEKTLKYCCVFRPDPPGSAAP